MSKQSDYMYELLTKSFPHSIITKEFSLKYKGQQLYFDYFIKNYNILIEVQGRQHSEYVKHFHGDKQGFLESKKRDNLKKSYCEENNLTLVTINFDESIDSVDKMLEKIHKALEVGE